MNLDEPKKYSEYKEMSDPEKKSYLEWIISKYHVSKRMIAEMMGCSAWKIGNDMNRLGIVFDGKKGPRDPSAADAWRRFCGADLEQECVARETDEQSAEENPEFPAVDDYSCLGRDEFHVDAASLCVYATPDEIRQLLTLLCGNERRLLRISFEDNV